MKQLTFLSICIVLFFVVVRCTKNNTTPTKNLAKCTTCSTTPLFQTPDTVTGLWYYTPTAFTPNGDGINDLFMVFHSNGYNMDSSIITIWDKNGNGVHEGNINLPWNGRDLKGVLCAAGHYPFSLKLRTNAGVQFSQCGCVSILTFKGNCVYTGGIQYYMPDQVSPIDGSISAGTQENLCP